MSNETPKEGAAGDPSMEEILSSIRRILSEDEAQAAATTSGDDVLVLDPEMMVKGEAPQAGEATPAFATAAPEAPEPEPEPLPAPERPRPEVAAEAVASVPEELPLLAPDTADSAAASIVGLVRTLAADRLTPVHRAGPTIEDLVREEIRPLLKAWLDAHLPGLVERLVRQEIERVVNRAMP